MGDSEKDFDWKGEAGDKFALANPSTAEGQDQEMLNYFKSTGSDIFKAALESLKSNSFPDFEVAKVIDVGCSSGGKLAILKSLGFNPQNLHGVDLSPKAISVTKENHPKFHVQEINGFDYNVFQNEDGFDLVYHSAVFCQIPEENYTK